MVNPTMPRSFGGSVLHSSHIDVAVEAKTPVFEGHLAAEPDAVSSEIGRLIATHLVEDGATIQLGKGLEETELQASATSPMQCSRICEPIKTSASTQRSWATGWWPSWKAAS